MRGFVRSLIVMHGATEELEAAGQNKAKVSPLVADYFEEEEKLKDFGNVLYARDSKNNFNITDVNCASLIIISTKFPFLKQP